MAIFVSNGPVFDNYGSPILLTCGMATVKIKGHCHLKTKVKITKNYENSFFAQFFIVKYSGSCHSSKVKGQGRLKIKFGAIVFYLDNKACYCMF